MAEKIQPATGRRDFFRAVRQWFVEEAGAIAEPFIDEFIEQTEPMLAALAGPPILRPPGAIDETLFRNTCTACHRCIESCPESAIVAADPEIFPGIAGSPVIIPRRRACAMCSPVHCQEACPSGALLPLTPADIRLGTAHVLTGLCLAHQGESCSVTACPLRGSAIEMRRGVPVVHPEACTGCGFCEYTCPTHPAAIRIQSPR
jgi:ferredoxin-type protein NapG